MKPYTQFHSYNIGIFLGCAYFSWKCEMNKGRSTQTKKSKLEGLYSIIKYQNTTALLCMVLGLIMMFMVLTFNKLINMNPDGVSFIWSFIYLMISRPCYTIGFALFIMPIILENPIFNSLKSFLSSNYWVPYVRLIYGVFLSNTIFMQMRIYNLERGIWADWYCTTLFFFAFSTFTFCFSFTTYMFVEAPLANLFNDFLRSKEPKTSAVFYRSQSAKAY